MFDLLIIAAASIIWPINAVNFYNECNKSSTSDIKCFVP